MGDEAYAEIDFVGGKFVLASRAFVGFQRRELVRLIRGCGGHVYRHNRAPADLTAVLFSLEHEIEGEGGGGADWMWEEQIVASSGLGLSANEKMSMLRGALQGTPSQAAWNHAVAVLETWRQGDGVEDAVRYVEDLTKKWPARMRVGTERWIKRAASGVSFRIGLAGSLELRNGLVDAADMRRVFTEATGLEHVTYRTRGVFEPPRQELEAVLHLADVFDVTSLRLDFSTYHFSESTGIVASRCGARLEVLEVRDRYRAHDGVYGRWWPFDESHFTTLEKKCPRLEIRLLDPSGEITRVRKNGKEVAS